MKMLKKVLPFLVILFTTILFSQEPEHIGYDFGFTAINAPDSGSIRFEITKVGIIFSGDNYNTSYCTEQDKIYRHEYQKKVHAPGCPFIDPIKSIIGSSSVMSWNSKDPKGPQTPSLIELDYVATGVPRDVDSWLGFGLYQVRIKNLNLNDESEYYFYIDFLDSKFRAPGGTGADITVVYDFNEPINERAKVITGDTPPITFKARNGVAYRIWNEIAPIPVNRYGTFYIRGNIPLYYPNTEILLSPAIVDMNTTIIDPTDPEFPEFPNSKIIIDPTYYPEPAKLGDLKLTIADNVTLNAQNRSDLIVGDGAQISLGSNSTVNISTGGNLFIGSNSNWSFGTGSQLIVNGNFKITSKIPSFWSMLSVPNIVSDYTKIIVWPNAVTDASTFEGGAYVAKSTLENGKGYWVKFNQDQVITYAGSPVLNSSDLINKFNVVSGWNMIGTISLNLLTSKITSDPPGIISSKFYGFNSGYRVVDTLRAGLGYWVKANQNGKIILNVNSTASSSPPQCSDEPSADPPGAPPQTTLVSPNNGATDVSRTPTLSWNPSNGATSYTLQVSSDPCFTTFDFYDTTITTTSKQVGPLGYSTAYYWRVRPKNDVATGRWSDRCAFTTLHAPYVDPCEPIYQLSAIDNISITDDNGNSQTIYTHNGGRKLKLKFKDFEMPPIPPKGVFDVRFPSGKFIETVDPDSATQTMKIKIKDAQYPISFSWDVKPENKTSYWLVTRKKEKISLLGAGSVSLDGSENGTLSVEAQAISPGPCIFFKADMGKTLDEVKNIPTKYGLDQNHPNPFNPTTIIKYQLPFNEEVTLKVYDVLGREVESLVNDYKEAGYYEVEFDASKLPSGVYFYKLQTRGNIAIKKMLLLR